MGINSVVFRTKDGRKITANHFVIERSAEMKIIVSLERLATRYSESRFGKAEIKFFRWFTVALLMATIPSLGMHIEIPIIGNALFSLAVILYAIGHGIRATFAYLHERRMLREVMKARDKMLKKIGVYN